jgi:hypothetical protein
MDKKVPEISSITYEEDSPEVATKGKVSKARPKKLKLEREEARKDADSSYARFRDRWVTLAGIMLVIVLIALYFVTVVFFEENSGVSSLLYLLNSVIMLIIGYVFGTKTTKH